MIKKNLGAGTNIFSKICLVYRKEPTKLYEITEINRFNFKPQRLLRIISQNKIDEKSILFGVLFIYIQTDARKLKFKNTEENGAIIHI